MAKLINLFCNREQRIALDIETLSWCALYLVTENQLYRRMKEKNQLLKETAVNRLSAEINLFNAMEPHLSAYLVFENDATMILKIFNAENHIIFNGEITALDLQNVIDKLSLLRK